MQSRKIRVWDAKRKTRKANLDIESDVFSLAFSPDGLRVVTASEDSSARLWDAKTGKPVAGFAIERSGDLKTIEAAARKAKEFVHYATALQREPFGLGAQLFVHPDEVEIETGETVA